MKTNFNDPAMPFVVNGSVDDIFHEPGLTKREYFAAMAMQGLLSNPTLTNIASNEHLCKTACIISGFLIAELNKEK